MRYEAGGRGWDWKVDAGPPALSSVTRMTWRFEPCSSQYLAKSDRKLTGPLGCRHQRVTTMPSSSQ